MAENKTKPTEVTVESFLASVADEAKRADSRVLVDLMQRVTGEPPKMWGGSIVGFGQYHYKYESGREGDSCLTGFSPRAAEFAIYITGTSEGAAAEKRDKFLAELGKHRMGKGCLYLKRLEGIDLKVLEKLVKLGFDETRARYKS